MGDTVKTAPWTKEAGYVPPHLRGPKALETISDGASKARVPLNQGGKASDAVTVTTASRPLGHPHTTPLVADAKMQNKQTVQVGGCKDTPEIYYYSLNFILKLTIL